MAQTKKGPGKGWHGDKKRHAEVGARGGRTTAEKYGQEFYESIGERGGRASSGKFKKGDSRAVEAGRKGGASRRKKSLTI